MSRATERLKSDKRAWFGGGVIVLLVLLAVSAPLAARHDPFGVDLINSLQPPNVNHWFGTDVQGRDVWARLVYGARVSLSVGIISQGIANSSPDDLANSELLKSAVGDHKDCAVHFRLAEKPLDLDRDAR